jgi:excisionase family DNA binding protein
METITTIQVQGITAEMLLKRFDTLESQIKTLQQQPTTATGKLMTRFEVSALLGVSLVTVHNWSKSNILTAHRIGNKVRFKENEVLNALQQINPKR